MLKIENVEVVGTEATIRGMRNPKNSWGLSDSYAIPYSGVDGEEQEEDYIVGPKDLTLAVRLCNGGPVHGKLRRMMVVYMDITAPLYWWKEFDTYKIGTVANSCSTMHKIQAKEFVREDFSIEHLSEDFYENYDVENIYVTSLDVFDLTINALNHYRKEWLKYEAEIKTITNEYKAGDKDLKMLKDLKATLTDLNAKQKVAWWQMIQLLPSSFNQKRTIQLNYEVLANIDVSRKNHKLDEWQTLRNIIPTLPLNELITAKKTYE